ncbi:peptidase inhibitor 16-like [Acanthopagrus latus]|uniref:peptidase inhibitor 16-like n=1 Tax=Acanthopagrus latus TaxID=8177 RepID=UPI00187C6195|nr:peptidase inhibitor 16-like [Acanthopagrus latus]
MQLWSLSELQGASTRRTTQDRAPRSSKPRRGPGRPRLCPPRGAPLWAWLLLGALVVPGAWSFLSEEQEELLVELHNHYRGQVSPSASAMLPLRWDPSLKVIAEGYAAKCVWNHNPDLEDTGENLYAGTGSLDLREALEKWFLEHLDYDFSNNSCDEDKMCGHYTQMVWADTHRVGCAFHLCNSMEGLGWERVSFLVCNYYPAGNYENERPYVEGDWCSRCPENLQNCENNLCVADTAGEEEDEDEDDGGVAAWTDMPYSTLDPGGYEGDVGPLPSTAEPNVPPAATTTTTSAPSVTTTSAWHAEDDPPPATPAPGTQPPEVPSITLGKEEEEEEDDEEEEVEDMVEKEERKKEEATRRETTDTMEDNEGRNRGGKIRHNNQVMMNAGSVASPSLLLVCLTAILTRRL